MALIIEHRFPLGRFHATRWKQNPFEDPYGEWPPSPWRLLRALAARWFQYTRETGDADAQRRDLLLQTLASSIPTFALPNTTWRGPALKQYQPTSVEWTDASKAAAGYKKPQTTLVEDHYRVLPPEEALYWVWDPLALEDSHVELLDHLLERTLYFGRAESFCRLHRVEELPEGTRPNCSLTQRSAATTTPVLVPIPGHTLTIATLLAATDDKEQLKGRPVPPGTTWYYAQLPPRPVMSTLAIPHSRYHDELHCAQFAVGGRVYPSLRHWVKITERFRGCVIRSLALLIAPDSGGRYDLLTPEQKEAMALMTGKDSQGQPLHGHRHAFFLLCPDGDGLPTRLVVWRSEAFTANETNALLKASEWPLAWENDTDDWKVCLVPLPFTTPPPVGLLSASHVWESATPFVPPAHRHRFRKNGRLRSGESLERILAILLRTEEKPEPIASILLDDDQDRVWVNLHETRDRRFSRESSRTPWVRPGFRFRVTFPVSVQGPLILGDSSHFGLGLFMAV